MESEVIMMDKLDFELLKAIYKMKFEQVGNPNPIELSFENNQHVAHSLNKLKSSGMISFYKTDTFQTGGLTNEKYHNDTVGVLWNKIEITEQGVSAVKEEEK
jgi:hypothetical protein